MPTIHLMGGTIMGTAAGNSVTNSYGQTHELRTFGWRDRGSSRPPEREPDLHDLCAVTARRREPGVELEHNRELIVIALMRHGRA